MGATAVSVAVEAKKDRCGHYLARVLWIKWDQAC